MITKEPRAGAPVTKHPVVPDVVLEHLEEVAFLNIQRRKLLFSHEITLEELGEHDERIVAHWDGLVLAQPYCAEMAEERLEEFDPWEAFAAARVWIELGDPSSEEVIEKIAAAEDDEVQRAWREALRRMPPEALGRVLPETLLRDGVPAVQSALTFGRGWHGTLTHAYLPDLVANEDASVCRSLARAIGWGDPTAPGLNEILRILADDRDVEVRRAALWSAVLVNPEAATARCRERVRSGDADAFDVRVLGLMGRATDLEVVTGLLESETLAGAAARALGDLGESGGIDALRHVLAADDEIAAEAASEALTKKRMPRSSRCPEGASGEGRRGPGARTPRTSRWSLDGGRLS
jgi:HEAT repeat protein